MLKGEKKKFRSNIQIFFGDKGWNFSVEPAVFFSVVKKFKFRSFSCHPRKKEVNNKRILLKSYVNDYTFISKGWCLRRKKVKVSAFSVPQQYHLFFRRQNTITLPVISFKISYLAFRMRLFLPFTCCQVSLVTDNAFFFSQMEICAEFKVSGWNCNMKVSGS